eukprot:s2890_g5.t1
MADGESEASDKAAADQVLELPQEFLQFLDANGVPKEVFTGAIRQEIPRYVRVNPRGPLADLSPAERQKAISQALQTERAVQLVQWLRAGEVTDHRYMEVYACPACGMDILWLTVGKGIVGDNDECARGFQASSNLSRTEAYRNGSLYGVDAASVFAVCCLQPRTKCRVSINAHMMIFQLGLPQAKGSHLGSLLRARCQALHAERCSGTRWHGHWCRRGRATTCGVSHSAAQVQHLQCEALPGRWHHLAPKHGGMVQPGCTSKRVEAAQGSKESSFPRTRGQRGRKRRFEEKAKAEETPAEAAETTVVKNFLYDRVLVDAECTHDASCRHLEKFRTQWGLDSLSGRVPWIRQEGLFDLQLGLLSNGFALLKEGGSLVYATCSLCQRQNEDVVDSLLKQNPSAALSALPLPLCAANLGEPSSSSAPARPSLLEAGGPKGEGGQYCTARFDPVTSGTSGLFIARLQKLKAENVRNSSLGFDPKYAIIRRLVGCVGHSASACAEVDERLPLTAAVPTRFFNKGDKGMIFESPRPEPERKKKQEQRSSSKAPVPKSGPARIRGPVLTGFDIANYGQDFKRATGDFLRRLLCWTVGQPSCASYDTVTDAMGNFQPVLRISHESQTAVGLLNSDFRERKCSSKKEAEESAAQAFWEHPQVLQKAQTLPPSKKACKQKTRCAKHNRKRKEMHPNAPWAKPA